MGYYIQTGTLHYKAEAIAAEHDGVVLRDHPKTFADIPDDKALVVVVDNGPFEAAALAYNESEFKEFTDPDDERPRSYVLLDKDLAYKLAGYEPTG